MTAHSELKTAILNKLESDSTFRTNMNAGAKTITGAVGTQTITVTAASHGLAVGDLVLIAGVVGMTVINTNHVVKTVPTANTFTVLLSAVTAQTYTSGGTVRRLASFYYQAPQGIAYPYCVFQDITNNYTFTSTTKTEERYLQFALYDNRASSYIATLESNLIDLLETTLTFSNYTQIFFERRNTRHVKDETDIWQTIIEYRILMEHN